MGREMTYLARTSKLKPGYTKAVDLWALGCVSAILLTGDPPFAKADKSASASSNEDLTLDEFETNPKWIRLSTKPKTFVRRLLAIDEIQRPTARKALNDPWLKNEVYKADFDKLYHKSIQHWTPRVLKSPPLEFVNAYFIKNLKCSQDVLRRTESINNKMPFHSRHKSVEAHYKPFARDMYSYLYFTPPSSYYRSWSPEVLAAIKKHWTPRKAKSDSIKSSDLIQLPLNNRSPSPQPAGLPRRRRSRSLSNEDDGQRPRKSARKSIQSPLLLNPSKSFAHEAKSLSEVALKTALPLFSDTIRVEATAFDPSAWNDGDLPLASDQPTRVPSKSGHKNKILTIGPVPADDKFPFLQADMLPTRVSNVSGVLHASKAAPMAPPPPPSTPVRPIAKLKRKATPLSILTSSPAGQTSLKKKRRRNESIFDISSEEEEGAGDDQRQQQQTKRSESKAAQLERGNSRYDEALSEIAVQCGLSVASYKRKRERGDIRITDEEILFAVPKRRMKECGLDETQYKWKLERGEIKLTDEGILVVIPKKDIKIRHDHNEGHDYGSANRRPKLQLSRTTNLIKQGKVGIQEDGAAGGVGEEGVEVGVESDVYLPRA